MTDPIPKGTLEPFIEHADELTGEITESAAREFFDKLLRDLQERQEQQAQVLLQFIRETRDWKVGIVREGMSRLHYEIRTTIPTPDGGMTTIRLDYAARSKDVDPEMQAAFRGAPKHGDDCDERVSAIITQASNVTGILEHYQVEAVEFFRELLGRSDVANDPHFGNWEYDMNVHSFGSREWHMEREQRDTIRDRSFSYHSFAVDGRVPSMTTDELFDKARRSVAAKRADDEVEGTTWRDLNASLHRSELTDDERAAIAKRMEQILYDANVWRPGYLVNWPKFFDMQRDAEKRYYEAAEWDDDFIEALRYAAGLKVREDSLFRSIETMSSDPDFELIVERYEVDATTCAGIASLEFNRRNEIG